MQDLSPPDDDRAVGPLAPYGTRLFGYVVDAIIVYGLVGVVVLEVLREPTRLITISAALAGLIYASILVALWGGATAGMHVAQVRCVNGQTLGAVTWPRSLGRAAIHAVLLIVPVLGLLDLLWPLWDRNNQTLHDKGAGTVVVRVP